MPPRKVADAQIRQYEIGLGLRLGGLTGQARFLRRDRSVSGRMGCVRALRLRNAGDADHQHRQDQRARDP